MDDAEKAYAAFVAFAEDITARAEKALKAARPLPQTAAEEALEAAYEDGLRFATSLTLTDLEEKTRALGCDAALILHDSDFLLDTDQETGPDLLAALYADETDLVALYDHDPKLAAAAVFWMGMNDIHHFALSFAEKVVFEDDFRGLGQALMMALRSEPEAFAVWSKLPEVLYADYRPTAPTNRPSLSARSFHA